MIEKMTLQLVDMQEQQLQNKSYTNLNFVSYSDFMNYHSTEIAKQ